MSDKDLEQGFNESELQDIMSEIENLEEEFASEDEVENLDELKIGEQKDNDLQKAVDEEVDSLLDSSSENEEVDMEAVHDEELIDDLDASLGESTSTMEEVGQSNMSDEKITPIHTRPSHNKKYHEGPSSSANFNMDFTIGDSPVSLNFNQELVLSVSGVEITINENDGCSVVLPGGIKFSVPLDSSKNKKAA